MRMSAILDPTVETRPLRRLEYERLAASGCFDGERVELIRGVLVRMSPIKDPHAFAVEQLNLLLVPLAMADRARVRIQSPMAASDDSMPEPDVLVSALDDRPGRHPARAQLLVEVADSSLRYDCGLKAELYASIGVPEYWVVNLRERCIEVFRGPAQGVYTHRDRVVEGAEAVPLQFPDVAVPVARLFAP